MAACGAKRLSRVREVKIRVGGVSTRPAPGPFNPP